MKIISLATGRLGPRLAIFLCRLLTVKQLYKLGDWISPHLVGKGEDPFTATLRANLAVVLGLPGDDPITGQSVVSLLNNYVRSFVDFFKSIQMGPEKIIAALEIDPVLIETMEECRAKNRGLIMVGAHTCGYQHFLLATTRLFPNVQILGNADPQGGEQGMHSLRLKMGVNVTQISVSSLRRAVEHLHKNGIVGIAADLPVETGEELTFFGKKAKLTTGYTRLALRTDSEVIVVFTYRVRDGLYRVVAEPIPQPISANGKKPDAVHWAQKTMKVIEGLISKWPDQWLVPDPVWGGGVSQSALPESSAKEVEESLYDQHEYTSVR